MSEDWDNLLLLDSCRFDTFREHSDLPGKLERRVSRGSATKEFLKGNFQDRTLHDTVYVTANPQLYFRGDAIGAEFHDVVHLWRDEGWDSELKTVPPAVTTDRAIEAAKEYPHKRLIVHYLQPHRPFLGPTGRQNTELPGFDETFLRFPQSFSREVYYRAFVENLELALEEIERLLPSLGGRTVVTSDHGQAIGDRLSPIPVKDYGHWRGNYIDALLEVPWHIIEGDERREIVSERPAQKSPTDDSARTEAADRLEHLGYVT